MACSTHDYSVSLCTSQLRIPLWGKCCMNAGSFGVKTPVVLFAKGTFCLCFLQPPPPRFSSVDFSFTPICCPFTSSSNFSSVSFVLSATWFEPPDSHVCFPCWITLTRQGSLAPDWQLLVSYFAFCRAGWSPVSNGEKGEGLCSAKLNAASTQFLFSLLRMLENKKRQTPGVFSHIWRFSFRFVYRYYSTH